LDESRIMMLIGLFRNALWPDGVLKTSKPPRSPEEKLRTKEEAKDKLSSLLPGTFCHFSRYKQLPMRPQTLLRT